MSPVPPVPLDRATASETAVPPAPRGPSRTAPSTGAASFEVAADPRPGDPHRFGQQLRPPPGSAAPRCGSPNSPSGRARPRTSAPRPPADDLHESGPSRAPRSVHRSARPPIRCRRRTPPRTPCAVRGAARAPGLRSGWHPGLPSGWRAGLGEFGRPIAASRASALVGAPGGCCRKSAGRHLSQRSRAPSARPPRPQRGRPPGPRAVAAFGTLAGGVPGRPGRVPGGLLREGSGGAVPSR
jgi:hypothetical protein